jgi:hypothetical protein
MIAVALPPLALMAIAVWSTIVIAVLTTLAAATRVAHRRAGPQRECILPAHCLGLKPGVLSSDVAAAYQRFVVAEFERDIAALRELEHVPDEWR